MTTFEPLATRETEYGNRNFIEVARKVARGERPGDEGTEFLSISRGYRTEQGDRRYKMHFTMPYEASLAGFVQGALDEVSK